MERDDEVEFATTITGLLGEGAPPKWTLSQLFKYLEATNVDCSQIWKQLKCIVILTILCLVNLQSEPNIVYSSCFELFGFGIQEAKCDEEFFDSKIRYLDRCQSTSMVIGSKFFSFAGL